MCNAKGSCSVKSVPCHSVANLSECRKQLCLPAVQVVGRKQGMLRLRGKLRSSIVRTIMWRNNFIILLHNFIMWRNNFKIQNLDILIVKNRFKINMHIDTL